MKILNFKSENIKRLVAVEIAPTGHLVQITGKNAQGKTSVLDSILWALQGKYGIQEVPIRKGQSKATIRLDMGEIVVTRTFSAKDDGTYTTAIKVEAEDGSKFTSPQTMIDELLGDLTFDPLSFTKIKDREQVKMLQLFVPEINFVAIDALNQTEFDERTEINRQTKFFESQAEGIEAPVERPAVVDIQSLNDLLRSDEIHNNSIKLMGEAWEKDAQAIFEKTDQMTEKVQRAQDLRHQAAALDEEVSGIKKLVNEMQATLDNAGDLETPRDSTYTQAMLTTANETNKTIEDWDRRQKFFDDARDTTAKSKALTKSMDDRKADTKAKIKAAKMPVPGLGFGENCILLNDFPFEQSSDAEQLKASIMIAMAMNPTLKVIRVRDGSLLDDDSLALLAQVAEEHDYQIWIEQVDSSGKIGFVIEDGSLKS